MYKEYGKYPNVEYKRKSINAEYNIDSIESIACTKKLTNEGYIEKLPSGITIITLDGLLFISNGGYTQKIKDIKAERFRQTLATWMTAIGTALAGIYGLVEMAKWLYRIFCSY